MQLDNKQWTEIIDKAGMPTDSMLTKEEYIGSMKGLLDASYPTQRIAIMNEQNAFNLEKSNNTSVTT